MHNEAKWDIRAKLTALAQALRRPGNAPKLAVGVAVVVLVIYLLCNLGSCTHTSSGTMGQSLFGTDDTDQLGAILSAIDGAGQTEVLVTYDKAGTLVGVIVVSDGAGNQQVVVKLLRAVQTATGATLDQIDIFERKH